MKQKSVTAIIILFSIALIGLLYSQWSWVNKSIKLKEEQFEHRVDMVLNDVVEEIERYKDTSLHAALLIDSLYNPTPKSILDVVEPVLLDTLLAKYTQYHNIKIAYGYAIVKTHDDSIIYQAPNYHKKEETVPYKACLSCLWEKEYFHLSLIFPDKQAFILTEFKFWALLSIFFVLIVGSSFGYTIITFLKQKKVSEIKNDFVSNMTHEFKTPISTIQLTGEVLQKKLRGKEDEVIDRYINIILNENLRMRTQVERILQMSIMEKGEFHLNKTSFDIHKLIKETVDNLCMDYCNNNANVKYELNAQNFQINADLIHVTNIIINLVQNSIKYSDKYPELKISTNDKGGGIKISVQDKGIGMSADRLKYIFEKFYRIPTGNVHNVKGFGLGLYYVKTMSEAHGGEVAVSSQLNKGSTFDVILPAGNA